VEARAANSVVVVAWYVEVRDQLGQNLRIRIRSCSGLRTALEVARLGRRVSSQASHWVG
jgi:hypothetical protein